MTGLPAIHISLLFLLVALASFSFSLSTNLRSGNDSSRFINGTSKCTPRDVDTDEASENPLVIVFLLDNRLEIQDYEKQLGLFEEIGCQLPEDGLIRYFTIHEQTTDKTIPNYQNLPKGGEPLFERLSKDFIHRQQNPLSTPAKNTNCSRLSDAFSVLKAAPWLSDSKVQTHVVFPLAKYPGGFRDGCDPTEFFYHFVRQLTSDEKDDTVFRGERRLSHNFFFHGIVVERNFKGRTMPNGLRVNFNLWEETEDSKAVELVSAGWVNQLLMGTFPNDVMLQHTFLDQSGMNHTAPLVGNINRFYKSGQLKMSETVKRLLGLVHDTSTGVPLTTKEPRDMTVVLDAFTSTAPPTTARSTRKKAHMQFKSGGGRERMPPKLTLTTTHNPNATEEVTRTILGITLNDTMWMVILIAGISLIGVAIAFCIFCIIYCCCCREDESKELISNISPGKSIKDGDNAMVIPNDGPTRTGGATPWGVPSQERLVSDELDRPKYDFLEDDRRNRGQIPSE